VTEGPDVGATLALDQVEATRVLVGQSPVCHLRLTDSLVSRRHFFVEADSRGLRITDAGSTNGTFVAGIRVLDALVGSGAILVAGNTRIRVVEVPQLSMTEPEAPLAFGRLRGASPAMQRVFQLAERIAGSGRAVVIEGERGTGKALLAEAIHDRSVRRGGPFVVCDAASFGRSDVERLLFGDGVDGRGAFLEADGGTLVLDEISEMPLPIQAHVVRALERREIRPFGGGPPRHFDCRLVATTREDLDGAVVEGRLRDDLFHLLAEARVELPPLRSREGDVALLAREFWAELGGEGPLDAAWLASAVRASWPGNVRELRSAVGRLVVGTDPPKRTASESLRFEVDPHQTFSRARAELLEKFDRAYVEDVLRREGGNVTRAAAVSGLARRYFQTLKARSR
jgi:DNA-binding NtrC family response regulator